MLRTNRYDGSVWVHRQWHLRERLLPCSSSADRASHKGPHSNLFGDRRGLLSECRIRLLLWYLRGRNNVWRKPLSRAHAFLEWWDKLSGMPRRLVSGEAMSFHLRTHLILFRHEAEISRPHLRPHLPFPAQRYR